MDGDAFRQCLRAMGLTQVQFAEAYGVSRRTVQYWCVDGPPPLVGMLLSEVMPDAAVGQPPADPVQRELVLREMLVKKVGLLPDRLRKKGWTVQEIEAALATLTVDRGTTHR